MSARRAGVRMLSDVRSDRNGDGEFDSLSDGGTTHGALRQWARALRAGADVPTGQEDHLRLKHTIQS